jgi:hypothetical protein
VRVLFPPTINRLTHCLKSAALGSQVASIYGPTPHRAECPNPSFATTACTNGVFDALICPSLLLFLLGFLFPRLRFALLKSFDGSISLWIFWISHRSMLPIGPSPLRLTADFVRIEEFPHKICEGVLGRSSQAILGVGGRDRRFRRKDRRGAPGEQTNSNQQANNHSRCEASCDTL